MRPVSHRRPLWYYGILCLFLAVVPTMVTGPPANPEAAFSRFLLMVALSAVGLTLIVISAVKSWRARKQQ